MESTVMLSATNLSKRLPDGRAILDGVDCAVEPGKLVALVGPSGGGKTTLLRCLSLLDTPDGGDVALDAVVYNFPLPEGVTRVEDVLPKPWPKVTAVFQQLFLWPHLTLRENILLPVAGRVKAGEPVEAELAELVKQFDMTGFLDRYPNQTSGGQRQRAALARALLLNPRYLLLDEITSALDIEQTAAVLRLLTGVRARGIGVLLITHHLGFARQAADRVLFMDGGKIVEDGGREILEKPQSKRFRAFLAAAEVV